ncbi:MAG: universal stress protein [Nitrospirae bacterium]|nr:universal stress protein [Nitrospirota bacterium]MCL5420934.1 universal stress protein [Nitrospirota bacterium]
MISRILVATDGSETAWKAVKYAAGLAKQTGAAVTVLSVIDKSPLLAQSIPAVAAPTRLIEPVEDYMRQAAEAYLARAETLCRKSGIKFKKVVRTGHPVDEIVKEATKLKAALIVIGSHGRGAMRAAVLGSIAYGVIHREAEIPVLIVR